MNDSVDLVIDEPKKASILVVDDKVANIKLVERILTMGGYTNIACTNDSRQVLPLYKKLNSDLILLDINMPIMDGHEVMNQLNTQTDGSLPPILVLTAHNAQSSRQRALDNGASDYITKPFNVDEMLSRVRNLLKMQIAQKYIRNQNVILEEKVQERTQAIHETRLKVIRHLGRAAEYRDNETGLHIIRMSKIAVELGRAIGMDHKDCDLLLHSAPMHDIGKIGIPDKILMKPGKLGPEEWDVMKTHAQVGADILAGDESDLMIMAHDIAISHHEKWNGKGYPNGLEGEEIPLSGRVSAVADVFDALTTKRPYKSAWPISKAIEYIESESGSHFDPTVVMSFLEITPNILEIIKKYAEPSAKSA